MTGFRDRGNTDRAGKWGHCITYDIGTPEESSEWVHIPVRGCPRKQDAYGTSHEQSRAPENALRFVVSPLYAHGVLNTAASMISARARC